MYRPDTSDEAQRVYDERMLQMTGEERFLRGLSLCRFSREIVYDSLKKRNPSASPEELKVLFFETLYGHLYTEQEKRRIHDKLTYPPLSIHLVR